MHILNLMNRGPLRQPEPPAEGPLGGLDDQPNGGKPPEAPAGGAAPPAPPAADPPAAPPADVITMPKKALDERLARERRSYLRSLGFESEQQLKDFQEAQKQRQQQEEEARRAQQSREEQLQEDLARERQAAQQAQEQLEMMRFQSHVSGICASVGVRNLDYALHLVTRAAEALPEGDELDVEAFLKERVDPKNEAHASTRAALGLEVAPVKSPAPATTTGAGSGAEPPPPTPGGDGQPADVYSMTPEQWNAHKQKLGLG